MKEATATAIEICPICQTTPLEHPVTGRRRITCSEACRKRRDRARAAEELRRLRAVAEAAFKAAQWRPR